MRRFKHWTPQYILDRLRVLVYERTHLESPWLTQTMVEILSFWLRPEDRGLEWGSGRSTLWFAQELGWLTSVEHDESWYRKVNLQLQERGIQKVDYRLCKDPSDYVAVADGLPPESLNFILVDGIERDLCAVRAIPLLKPGGILVIDNSNWYLPCQSRSPNSRSQLAGPASETWATFLERVKHWRSIWTTNGVCDTALYLKPCKEKAG